jgi:hypothetical protein
VVAALAVLVEESSAVDFAWCGRRDSNPHASRRHPLKMVRLPVPPLPHGGEVMILAGPRAAGKRTFTRKQIKPTSREGSTKKHIRRGFAPLADSWTALPKQPQSRFGWGF